MALGLNADRGYNLRDNSTSFHRSYFSSCISEYETLSKKKLLKKGCTRCEKHCPLYLNKQMFNSPIKYKFYKNLPVPINEYAIQLISEIEALKLGTIVLFGSTSIDTFSYALIKNKPFLQSDLEFNIIVEKDIPSIKSREIYDIIKRYLKLIGTGQPLFDIDIRVRTQQSLKELDYDLMIRKSLFCHGIKNKPEKLSCYASETDVLNLHNGYSSYFRSSLEWLVLRIFHVKYLDRKEKQWWIKAILASFICKLAPNYLIKYGLPYTGSKVDAQNLVLISSLDQYNTVLRNFSTDFKSYVDARLDRTGIKINEINIDLNRITSYIKDLNQFYSNQQLIKSDQVTKFTNFLISLSLDKIFWDEPTKYHFETAELNFNDFFENFRNKDENFALKYRFHLYNNL